jgi:glycosyltransferase involved in cell wall biosynthesis
MKRQSLKVLFLVPRLDKASTRYRVLQYLPLLDREGIDYEIVALSRNPRHRFSLARRIKAADTIFIQKKLFSFLELFWIRKLARRLIYDFDDAVMFKGGPAGERQQARQQRRFAITAEKADLVIAGNRYLQQKALPLNRQVRLLPTVLDMDRYSAREGDGGADGEIVLGWIGSRGTLRYLQDISPALEELGSRWPGLKLKIVADDFFDLNNLQVIKKPWAAADEIADLHSFDIGLMPLSDDVWTRGKCGFKLLQCMAVGVPVVCSPVGVNAEIVTEGCEGLYATTLDEWVKQLDALIADGDLRRRMGQRGRQRVAAEFSLAANGPRFVEYLKNRQV